jgi:hypothetical protein
MVRASSFCSTFILRVANRAKVPSSLFDSFKFHVPDRSTLSGAMQNAKSNAGTIRSSKDCREGIRFMNGKFMIKCKDKKPDLV